MFGEIAERPAAHVGNVDCDADMDCRRVAFSFQFAILCRSKLRKEKPLGDSRAGGRRASRPVEVRCNYPSQSEQPRRTASCGNPAQSQAIFSPLKSMRVGSVASRLASIRQ